MTTKVLAVATVLLVHTAAAHAQQSPPAAAGQGAADYPPPYAPPPGFVPPGGQGAPPPSAPQTYYGPPGGYSYPPNYDQPSYAPPPPRQITHRPFTLGGGIGFGGLAFKDNLGNRESAWGMGYSFRLGFGLRPGLILLWDVEGSLINEGTGAVSQTANLAALQLFLSPRLFVKGGFGFAQVVIDESVSKWGGAAMGGVGYEVIQGWNWSMALEATITGARYNYTDAVETWNNWSLVNFVINFF